MSSSDLIWPSGDDEPSGSLDFHGQYRGTHFTPINPRGSKSLPCIEDPYQTPQAPQASDHAKSYVDSSKYRAAILESAQRIVDGLPKKNKPTNAAQKVHKRKISVTDFELVEDSPKVPHALRQVAAPEPAEKGRPASLNAPALAVAEKRLPDAGIHLTEASLNKLNAFRHKPAKLRKAASPYPEKQRQENFQCQTGEGSPKCNPKSEHKGLATTDDKASVDLEAQDDWGLGDSFDQYDTIFDQLIANDEADVCQLACTPITMQPSQDLLCLSALTPVACFPPVLLSSTPTYGQHQTLPNVPSPSTPPIKVIFRSSLPSPAPYLSPVSNRSPSARVLTCFRIVDALRLLGSGGAPFRIIELYAFVISSTRQSQQLMFEFGDLFFPQCPPYLHGRHNRWEDSELFDRDLAASLTLTKERSGKRAELGDGLASDVLPKCRAIIGSSICGSRAHRCASSLLTKGSESGARATGARLEVEVLSIWKCDWDDIDYV